ncbi:hypothetical protein PG994_009725 [Apiospora phragmitis]|uniref:Uncharacterized protein n=1 Tax=Apiospora phragmitis TaxID=2905665 RepID=A0ABR1U6X1_9PEZI
MKQAMNLQVSRLLRLAPRACTSHPAYSTKDIADEALFYPESAGRRERDRHKEVRSPMDKLHHHDGGDQSSSRTPTSMAFRWSATRRWWWSVQRLHVSIRLVHD